MYPLRNLHNALRFFFILFFTFFLLSGCRKENASIEAEISNAKFWFETYGGRTKNYVKTNRGDSSLILNVPVWSQAETERLEDGTILISTPVKTNLFELMGQNGDLKMIVELKNKYYKIHFIAQQKNALGQKISFYDTKKLFQEGIRQSQSATKSTINKRLHSIAIQLVILKLKSIK